MSVNEEISGIYEFGVFRLDAKRRLLLKEGVAVQLTPKLFDTLRVLVEHSSAGISKDELMHEVWGDTIVEETNLTTNISLLRKALGEKRDEHNYIVTIPGEGYRFVAEVSNVLMRDVSFVAGERTSVVLDEELKRKKSCAGTNFGERHQSKRCSQSLTCQ